MDNSRFSLGQWFARTGVAVGAAALLVTGAAWSMLRRAQHVSRPRRVAANPPITRAIAGGRDSYADIVKVVAPSVVTIRVEGKANASPTPSSRCRTTTSSGGSSAIPDDRAGPGAAAARAPAARSRVGRHRQH